jgi:hypothetical protein
MSHYKTFREEGRSGTAHEYSGISRYYSNKKKKSRLNYMGSLDAEQWLGATGGWYYISGLLRQLHTVETYLVVTVSPDNIKWSFYWMQLATDENC